MDVEEVLGSRGRIRVLRIILTEGQVTITRLVRESGLHYRLVVKHVRELERLGLVRVKRIDRMRLVEARLDDPRVAALRDLFRQIEML